MNLSSLPDTWLFDGFPSYFFIALGAVWLSAGFRGWSPARIVVGAWLGLWFPLHRFHWHHDAVGAAGDVSLFVASIVLFSWLFRSKQKRPALLLGINIVAILFGGGLVLTSLVTEGSPVKAWLAATALVLLGILSEVGTGRIQDARLEQMLPTIRVLAVVGSVVAITLFAIYSGAIFKASVATDTDAAQFGVLAGALLAAFIPVFDFLSNLFIRRPGGGRCIAAADNRQAIR